ncbi:MAG: phosphotransferase [Nitrospiraceae bacterium]|nr:phosphotransferase [Nitrospiraceae bacterium]
MAKYPLNIFLPAAGLGERLRPVTNHLPKPLLPILGRPLIGIILGKLTSVCSGRIGVNLHYKPELIMQWFKDSAYEKRVTVFPENPILGTGGALKNAESLLSGGPFIVHNADILLDMEFSRLIEAHLSSGSIATLVTHRHPDLSNVVIDDSGCVIDVENPGQSRPNRDRVAKKVAYTGIAVYSPKFLDYLPAGVSHATVAWLAAAKAGHKVKTFDVTGAYWSDIGNPATYASAVLDALRMIGDTVYCSPHASVGKISVDGYAIVERGATVRDGARLRNCIVMPGADAAGEQENCIIGPDYTLRLSEQEMQPAALREHRKDIGLASPLFGHFHPHLTPKTGSIASADLIGLGGSDRRYFRVKKEGVTAVLMECRKDDPDYERHLVLSRFFESHNVPVPKLLGSHEQSRRALFEDLGDLSLYSALRFMGNSQGRVEKLYRQVLDILVLLHGTVTDSVSACPPLASRIFDYEHLRWETSYFLERFVTGFRKAIVADRKALDEELHRLAQAVSAFLPAVIHRDFQCQNIMIRNDLPRLIDFQGARMAPPAYDLVSILSDPYFRLDDGMRERLLDYYCIAMRSASPEFDEPSFRRSLLPCGLQRHMQALGAYGFLSLVKGKKYFFRHVPEALRLLKEETARSRVDYPVLADLVASL